MNITKKNVFKTIAIICLLISFIGSIVYWNKYKENKNQNTETCDNCDCTKEKKQNEDLGIVIFVLLVLIITFGGLSLFKP